MLQFAVKSISKIFRIMQNCSSRQPNPNCRAVDYLKGPPSHPLDFLSGNGERAIVSVTSPAADIEQDQPTVALQRAVVNRQAGQCVSDDQLRESPAIPQALRRLSRGTRLAQRRSVDTRA